MRMYQMSDYKQCADKAQTGPGVKPTTAVKPAQKAPVSGAASLKQTIAADAKAIKA